MFEQIYSQKLKWKILWKICIKNQQSSEAIEFKGLFRGGWEKTSYPGISAEGYRQKHKMQVASKKVYWKKTFS